MKQTKYLIIGSGVAGSMIAEPLLAGGLGPVTMLEAGPPVRMRHRRHWLDYVMAGRLPYDHLSDQPEDYDSDGTQPWRIEGGRLVAQGGSTLHWGGWCPRFKPEDFALETNIGKGGLDWPFSYEALEPYYHRAEQYLQVAGDSSSSDPARKDPYLFEAPPYSKIDEQVIQAFSRLGITYGHMPVARNGRPVNDMPACMTTGTCHYCPIGGRFTGDQPLDRLKIAEQFTLLSNTPVTGLLADGKRIFGAEYLDTTTGKSHRLEAETVILCAGSLETPKLLLSSVSAQWPHGIGNTTDQVGRYLIANPYFYARAVKASNPQRLQEEVHFPTLSSRHWDSPKDQAAGKFILNRGESPHLNPGKLMSRGIDAKELEAKLTGEQVFELQAAMHTFCHAENRITPAGGTTRFGLPRTHIRMPVPLYSPKQKDVILERMRKVLETMGYQMLPGDAGLGVYPQRGDHAMATCRISKTPEKGVVDADLKVHGTENLYLVGNAVFPSGSAANPTLTLAALTFRFIDHLIKQT